MGPFNYLIIFYPFLDVLPNFPHLLVIPDINPQSHPTLSLFISPHLLTVLMTDDKVSLKPQGKITMRLKQGKIKM